MVSLEREEEVTSEGPTYRKAEYIKLLERNANPIVGPGSYDPKLTKAKLANVDWSKMPERFKLKAEDATRNKQPHSYAPAAYVPHLHQPTQSSHQSFNNFKPVKSKELLNKDMSLHS